MFEQTFKNIDDVLWKEAGCTTELDYTEQTSWMLFLKYLDDLGKERELEAQLQGKPFLRRGHLRSGVLLLPGADRAQGAGRALPDGGLPARVGRRAARP